MIEFFSEANSKQESKIKGKSSSAKGHEGL
jgi:hypothetical protein